MIIQDPEDSEKVILRDIIFDLPEIKSPVLLAAEEQRPIRLKPRKRSQRRIIKTTIYLIILSVILLGSKYSYGRPGHADINDLGRDPEVEHEHEHEHEHKHSHHDTPKTAMSMKELEQFFLAIPSSESAHGTARRYATHPHLAGSSQDYLDAVDMLDFFQKEFGIPIPPNVPIYSAGSPESRNATLDIPTKRQPSAWVDTYYPYLDNPLDRSLQILDDSGNAVWNAYLEEDGDPLDKDAHQYRDYVPAWLGYSFDGEAEGKLVYANYGTQEDYAELIERGVSFEGKIVIVRFGEIYRGLKVKGAGELGAVGVLIFSDPRDDGYVTIENGFSPYPHGPARNSHAIQRGSTMYLSIYPGDPMTPGYPAYKDAEQQKPTNIPSIPALPISWHNAQRILEEIGDIYDVGSSDGLRRLSGRSSERSIKIVNHVDAKTTPIWNTMATLPGHIRDEVVLIGCHRDAWVLGGADPVSGTVSLHEIIRGFGAMWRKGWRPLRTIMFASWDGEEQGLLGSTEFGEDFAPWISEHVVSYLNVDVSSSGSKWSIGGSPSLANMLKQAALDVAHPTEKGKTLWDARSDEGSFCNMSSDNLLNIDYELLESYQRQSVNDKPHSTGVAPLGSGSDYTVFQDHIGVASTDQGFGFTPCDAVYHYHSIYDSLMFQETFADPEFRRHVAVAQHLGLVALRISESMILPLNTTQYAFELDDYISTFEEDVMASQFLTTEQIDLTSLREAVNNLQNSSLALDEEKFDAEVKFQALLDQINAFDDDVLHRISAWFVAAMGASEQHVQHATNMTIDAGQVWEDVLTMFKPGNNGHRPEGRPPKLPFPVEIFIEAAERVSAVNKKLRIFEQGFISKDGIKDREWYKHLGAAPGKWLGYGATTLPALTEAVVYDKNLEMARYEVTRLSELLNTLSVKITT